MVILFRIADVEIDCTKPYLKSSRLYKLTYLDMNDKIILDNRKQNLNVA